MDITYLISHLISLSHIPVWVYSAKNGTILQPGQNKESKPLNTKEEKIIRDTFVFENSREMHFDKIIDSVFYVSMQLDKEQDEWILVGPVLISPSSDEQLKRTKKQLKLLSSIDVDIIPCQMQTFVSDVLMIYYLLTGNKLDNAMFWEKNQERFPSIAQMYSKLSQNVFERQEKQTKHNPYNQELRELDSIQNGDVEGFNKSISETYEGEIGILAKEPLRHHKNVAIGNITMASRAAVRGGVNSELAFSMADSFIMQIEEIDDISEVEAFKREAQRAYAIEVSKCKAQMGSSNNPLIEAVKNYIFSHLHDNIRIEDIAQSLHVNSDYLSHLFSEKEKVTIKRYILQEKINRSKNLLCYSNYSLQEIAFYLGFSTQSYFTQTFREIVGTTPGEYRKMLKYTAKK